MKLKISIQKQKLNNLELNIIEKDLAKLIGFLLTDGGVSKVSGKWRIHFTSNSDTLNEEFRNLINKIYGYKLATEKRFGAKTLRTWINKEISNELLSLTPNYRTLAYDKSKNDYPNAIIPKFILNNRQYGKEFLKYAFTSDGSAIFCIGRAKYGFKFDRFVKICCEHPNLREQYYKLLKKLGYKPSIQNDYVCLRGKENLEKFYKEIGFIEDVEISGNGPWNGITKQELLKFCVKSFDFKPSNLGNSKKQIHINLLKNLASERETG